MTPTRHQRLPISTRHAFALAFDLAVRRDFVHSTLVPLLLRAPWLLSIALLPGVDQPDAPVQVMLLRNAAVLGDFVAGLTVAAMWRFRARSVFNTPPEVRPAPVQECYAMGLRRLPWLFGTEVVRNLVILLATPFFILPAIFLGWRLSFATEGVVLRERNMASAFQRSFNLAEGRFERWFEMNVVSVVLGLLAIIVGVGVSLILGLRGFNAAMGASQLTIALVMPVIQYAWTFFYLRLVEVEDQAPGVEVGPAYAGAIVEGPSVEDREAAHPPMLTLVESQPPKDSADTNET